MPLACNVQDTHAEMDWKQQDTFHSFKKPWGQRDMSVSSGPVP